MAARAAISIGMTDGDSRDSVSDNSVYITMKCEEAYLLSDLLFISNGYFMQSDLLFFRPGAVSQTS
ncbi:hypothetical protein N7488_007493 [Penicillium malachiteum]|nr:hypothetical protein N7488_007493 [Penicillium malachiteum]